MAAYIDVVNPEGDLVQSGMGLRFARTRKAAEILTKLEKFGVGLLVKEDGTVVDDDEDVDIPCVYRLISQQRPVATSFNRSASNTTEIPGPVEEILRSVEVALKRHTQLMETLIRTGVKIATSSSPQSSQDEHCDSQARAPRRSPESSSAAEDLAVGTSSGTCKL